MAGVFISYRRRDSEGYATALAQELQRGLGAWTVFLDLSSLDLGGHFPTQISQALEKSSVVLVVIGKGWLHAEDDSGKRRLDSTADWVRTEIREAFRLGRRVIPVLVQGAPMPAQEDLPEDIRRLAGLQAIKITNLATDANRLCDVIANRSSVAEPALVMALAASVAFAVRSAQRGKLPMLVSDQFEASSVVILRTIFSVTGTSLYYAILFLGVLVAVRTRTGWRLEEMIRIAGCIGLGAGLGEVLVRVVALDPSGGRSWVAAFQIGVWFAGIAAGMTVGVRNFVRSDGGPLRPWLICCVAFTASAVIGSLLQSWFLTVTQLSDRLANPRTLLWGTVLVGTVIAWYWQKASADRPTGPQLALMLLPTLLAMFAADLLSIVTRPLPVGDRTSNGASVMQEKLALDNALFFAAAAAVGAWRVNVWQRERFRVDVPTTNPASGPATV